MHGQSARAARIDRDHVIGMGHLQPAVVGFELARDQPLAAYRQQPLEIDGIGIEIDQLERGAAVVLDQHAIGRARSTPAAAAAPMLGDRDFEGGELADFGVGDTGRRPPGR